MSRLTQLHRIYILRALETFSLASIFANTCLGILNKSTFERKFPSELFQNCSMPLSEAYCNDSDNINESIYFIFIALMSIIQTVTIRNQYAPENSSPPSRGEEPETICGKILYRYSLLTNACFLLTNTGLLVHNAMFAASNTQFFASTTGLPSSLLPYENAIRIIGYFNFGFIALSLASLCWIYKNRQEVNRMAQPLLSSGAVGILAAGSAGNSSGPANADATTADTAIGIAPVN